ncbi:MAG: beta-galactosidase [Planctomycetota bacterium]|nr:beta-galactosidase [Planctomycetota bacterium]
MRTRILLLFAAVSVLRATAARGEEALPVWPEPGSRFDEARARVEVPADRLGTAVWENPPAVVSPYEPSWYDYVPIVWGKDDRIKDTSAYVSALRSMFVRGTMNYSQADPAEWAAVKCPFYCTNLTNNLYIRNKSGPKLRDGFKKTRSREYCVRQPSLEDPANDEAEKGKAAAVARRCAALKPLGYDLRDEATYSISSACPHDFDFSDVSIGAFRKWLKAKYGTLEALNAEWETKFGSWEQVFPLMTDEIQEREFRRIARANLAPWADHREYNDDTFSSAIARYRDAIRAIDPGAPVGISGTQMPSAWGGFDFWKLCNVIGWIEHYDCNGSREMIRSFLPKRYPAIAATPYNKVDDGIRRMWYFALHGDSGGLVWPYSGNDTGKTLLLDVKDGTVTLTKAGENLKAIFREARSGIPCLLRRADPVVDPVGILHSQASLRADWMFEVKRDGKTWYNRYSSYEGRHNYAAAGREGFCKLIEDLGVQYHYYSSSQVAGGELLRRGVKLFIVPRGMALSKAEIEALAAFVEAGGVLVTDLMAGRMSENCRVWPADPGPMDALLGVKRAPFAFEEETKEEESNGYKGGFGRHIEVTMLSDFGGLKAGGKFTVQGFQEPGLQAGTAKAMASTPTGPAILEQPRGRGFVYTLNFDIPNYLKQRAAQDAEAATMPVRELMAALLGKAGVGPAARVRAKGGSGHPLGWETFRFSLGTAAFFAFHVNGSVRIEWEDLSDAGAGVAAAQGIELDIQLPVKGFVTELRTGKSLGMTDRVQIKTEKDRPVILAALPYEVKGIRADIGAGKITDGRLPIEVAVETPAPALDHVVHAELLDAKGETVPESVVNIPLKGGAYKGAIDMSFVRGEGPWTLRLRDVASGKAAEFKVSR